MTNVYWTHKGQEQELYDKMVMLVCNFGFTENEFLNCYIAMRLMYADLYSTNGYGHSREFRDYVPLYIAPFISVDASLLSSFEYIEEKMTETLLFVKDKDLSYPVFPLWFKRWGDDDRVLASFKDPRIGPHDDTWLLVTFGIEAGRRDWSKEFLFI